ncbi:MAG: ABC transporter permease [Oceanibaculum nanhaiense]|jgi:spermidine/putrescine transport system permease protein|uniref:ABC transporter permease n=1 Tax=Oceanibaculum nanhaiense TaxID=1909734 RepID=UPI0032EE69BC
MSSARHDGGTRLRMVYAGLYLAFLYVPVFVLPVFSFNDSIFVAFPLKGFTTQWYAQLAESPRMFDALAASLKVAIFTAVASTLLGIFAAKAMTRYRFPLQRPLFGLVMLPLVIPEIILGISLLILVNRLGLSLSLLTVAVGHILLCVPFATGVLISRFEGFDRSLEEASLDLGESAWMTFWRVTFPIVFPGIVASLLLSFTISFDEFIIAFFLSGTDPTLPLYIFSQLRFPQRLPGVLALGTLILLGSALLIVLAEWLRRRGVQPDKQPDL